MDADKAIEYNFKGDNQQQIEITLKQGDSILGDADDLMYMALGIHLDDPKDMDNQQENTRKNNKPRFDSQKTDFNHKKVYTNDGFVQRNIIFANPYRGKIVAINLRKKGSYIYCLSKAFLCATKGESIHVEPQRKHNIFHDRVASFEMERISGDGVVFLNSNGNVVKRVLGVDEVFRVDMGCLLAMSQQVAYDYQIVGNNQVDDYACMATVSGPGTVWLQSSAFGEKQKHHRLLTIEDKEVMFSYRP